MTDDNSNLVDMNDDQEAFEAQFFKTTSAGDYHGDEVEEEVEAPEDEEVTETDLETEEDTDAEAPEEESEDDEAEEEAEEAPKPKARKSAKERIDELTAEKYELRRELEALRRDFESSKPRQEKVEPVADKADEAPDAYAEDENGDMLYPMGEFDPKYIRDLSRFESAQALKELKAEQAREAQQRQVEAAQNELTQKWNERMAEAEKDIPEIRENIQQLGEVFRDVDTNYGEYLASVVMSSEVGPQIMNYLSENIGEAQKIVASGPAAATLALGRLEARFIKSSSQVEQEQLPKKKVSVAKDPPEQRTRGSSGRFSVSPDTEDQDAFEDLFYERKRK